MAYGAKTAVDGLSLSVARGSITAVLGPNGAGKTTTLETCEGYRKPQQGRVRVLGLDPQAQRRDLLPRIGVMLQNGGAWSGVRAVEMLRHIATPARPPAAACRCWSSGSAWSRAAARRTGGSRGASSSGSRWRWRSSAAPSWCSSTSRPRAWTRRPAATPGTCSTSCARDGVTIVLTTHYMDEAERLADQVHVIDRGRLIASGSPFELTRGTGTSTIRLVVTEPFPPDAPASLQATLGAGHRGRRRSPRRAC